ncbi:MAG: MogA/MoaB family molybdenum cofactor biosynthesis protein [Candidatus Heimdallarchaeaceae archaeon]
MKKTPKHQHITKKNLQIKAKILMISDTLSNVSEYEREKKDKSSKVAIQILKEEKITTLDIEYIQDDMEEIREKVKKSVGEQIDLILTIGGTGIAPRDVTIEAVKPLLDKELPGFGELFRHLTYKEVGTVSLMTRALAGVRDRSLIVSLPGSPNAVKLGVNLILKEIVHILNLRMKEL